jgi:HEAT repeat protein
MKRERCNTVLVVGMMVAILSGAFSPFFGTAVNAGEQEEVVKLLESGIREYEKGEYETAKRSFEQLLELKPSSSVAFDMQRRAELEILVEISICDKPDLAKAAKGVLKLLGRGVRYRQRRLENPEQVLTDFQGKGLEPYLKARATLVAHGPYALPYLLQFLEQDDPEDQVARARAISTIVDIGRPAILPLLAVLQAENKKLRLQAVQILGQIGGRRAVPALLTMAKRSNSAVLVETAGEALRNITGRPVEELGEPADQYVNLCEAYLHERRSEIGYVLGEQSPIWKWNPQGQTGQERLAFELFPAFLYYQVQGTQLALRGLEIDPTNRRLQGLMLATMVRQYALTRAYSQRGTDEEMKEDASRRLERLDKEIDTICHLYGSTAMGKALKYLLEIKHNAAALYMVKQFRQAVGVVGDDEATTALMQALEYPDKHIRFNAAVQIVILSPEGEIGSPESVMQVLSAALQQATQKTALLIFDRFQIRNRLSEVLERQHVIVVSAGADTISINEALRLQPAIDMLFVQGDLPGETLGTVVTKIQSDSRTNSVPVYAISAEKGTPDALMEVVDRSLVPEEVRDEIIGELITRLSEREELLGASDRGEIVLDGSDAMHRVHPGNTHYPLGLLEPALISALDRYGESIQRSVAINLARFGSPDALPPLLDMLKDGNRSGELTAECCRAIAHILQRHDAALSGDEVAILAKVLRHKSEMVRITAAEALALSGADAKVILKHATTFIEEVSDISG